MTVAQEYKNIIYHSSILIKHQTTLTEYFSVKKAFQLEEFVVLLKNRMNFEFTSTTSVLYNVANVHIVNCLIYIPDSVHLCPHKCVATISSEDYVPAGMGLAPIFVTDNDNLSIVARLENVLYFPELPVNIVIIVYLGDTC